MFEKQTDHYMKVMNPTGKLKRRKLRCITLYHKKIAKVQCLEALRSSNYLPANDIETDSNTSEFTSHFNTWPPTAIL